MSEMMPKFFLGPFPEIQRLIFFNNVHYVYAYHYHAL